MKFKEILTKTPKLAQLTELVKNFNISQEISFSDDLVLKTFCCKISAKKIICKKICTEIAGNISSTRDEDVDSEV